MASIAVTSAWSDPSVGLTADQVYIVQNKATQAVQFFEGATFDATTNANDGIVIVPLSDGGSGSSSIRWSYDSGNQVRMKLLSSGFGGQDRVEFALAT